MSSSSMESGEPVEARRQTEVICPLALLVPRLLFGISLGYSPGEYRAHHEITSANDLTSLKHDRFLILE
jgi:hypothetical protein